jgi:hypothetical protein
MARSAATSSFFLSGGALACWALMFFAGQDVWHDTGRLDLWHLEGPPYHDLRAFIVMFYALLALLMAQFVVSILQLRNLKRG